MDSFTNKVVLVTGGSVGIGRETALAFAQKGAKVVVASRRVKEGEETVQLIKASGCEGMFLKTDVRKAVEVETAIGKTVEYYGRLDCAFNNAGVEGTLSPIVEDNEEDWDRIVDINLKGTWLSMKYEIPQMLKQGEGVIVNNASIVGLTGIGPNISIYSASKHGVIGLTKSLAVEYAKAGIRINVVCPGAIETPMFDRITANNEQTKAQRSAACPMGRIGKPKEVADAVIWLCSDAATFVTGHSLVVDGGYLAA